MKNLKRFSLKLFSMVDTGKSLDYLASSLSVAESISDLHINIIGDVLADIPFFRFLFKNQSLQRVDILINKNQVDYGSK